MRKSAFIFLVLFCSACSVDLPDANTIIEEIYRQQVEEFRVRDERECRAKALSDAEAHVDSIVYQLLNADLVDSLSFPDKPIRPSAPDHIIGTVKKFDVNAVPSSEKNQ